jgi:hypothetical protein
MLRGVEEGFPNDFADRESAAEATLLRFFPEAGL